MKIIASLFLCLSLSISYSLAACPGSKSAIEGACTACGLVPFYGPTACKILEAKCHIHC